MRTNPKNDKEKTRKPRSNKPKDVAQQSNAAKFKDDFVYEGNSAIDKITNYVTQFGPNPKLEFEYSDKYFVVTNTFYDEVRRKVYIGSFDITDDGIIRRATVSEERTQDGTQIFRYAPFTLENVDGLVRFWAASMTARRATGEQFTVGDSTDPINQQFFPNDWRTNPFASNLI